jgi:hypothetical protein
MSLWVYLVQMRPTEVHESNITHNLNKMASESGLYQALWRPEELGVVTAWELIPYLREGLKNLKSDPEHYEQFNPPNGWGSYNDLVRFTEQYLESCMKYPDSQVKVSR